MVEQRTIPSTSDHDTRAGSTRRQALMTMVTGGVLGMLAVGPAVAQSGGPHYHGRVSLAERRRYAEAKRHFWATVNAFNDKTIPVEQSRLWQELDPDVAIYDFDSGNQIMARGLQPSVYYLHDLPAAKFDPAPGTICFHLHRNPQMVTGNAYWTGNDGAGTQRIFFTWELNNHVVASMKGQAPPPVA